MKSSSGLRALFTKRRTAEPQWAAAIAGAAGIPISTHFYPEVGAHVMRVAESAYFLEWLDWRYPVLQRPYEIRNGQVQIPDTPGIGIEWDEKAVAASQVLQGDCLKGGFRSFSAYALDFDRLTSQKVLDEACYLPNAQRTPSAGHAKLLFEQALNMHQRGKLDEAEHLYRTILKAYPDHPDCRHLLGVLRFQQGRNDEALEHISAALKVQPSNAAALSNYGLVLAKLGRLGQALASFDKALAIKPDDAEALNNRGNVLQNLKRFDEALASFDKALAIKPDHAKALSNRGNVLQNLKRFDEALASYDKALAIKPDHGEALNNRGVVLIELKRFAEALASFDKALAIKPDEAEALNNRGVRASKSEALR